jgi:hypothetical protein
MEPNKCWCSIKSDEDNGLNAARGPLNNNPLLKYIHLYVINNDSNKKEEKKEREKKET